MKTKTISITESDFKCYTCQKGDCMLHHNNMFRDILSSFNIDDPDNDITGIDITVTDVEVTDKYEEEISINDEI